jgi:hypothetical protein
MTSPASLDALRAINSSFDLSAPQHHDASHSVKKNVGEMSGKAGFCVASRITSGLVGSRSGRPVGSFFRSVRAGEHAETTPSRARSQRLVRAASARTASAPKQVWIGSTLLLATHLASLPLVLLVNFYVCKVRLSLHEMRLRLYANP